MTKTKNLSESIEEQIKQYIKQSLSVAVHLENNNKAGISVRVCVFLKGVLICEDEECIVI